MAHRLKANPGAAAAAGFLAAFVPREGVDYGWVAEVAREKYAAFPAANASLDAKATSVVTYLGGGSGAYSLGLLAVLAGGQIQGWVVLAAVPALLCAVAAVIEATRARRTVALAGTPDVQEAVSLAEYYPDRPTAEAVYGLRIALSSALNVPLNERKADLVDWALGWSAASVACLILPVLAGIGFRAFG